MSAHSQQLANFIWSVADLLRGPYRPQQYERVMLPLTVLRRFDAVLAPCKEAVLKRYDQLKTKKIPNTDAILNQLAKDEHGKPLAFTTTASWTSRSSRATRTTSPATRPTTSTAFQKTSARFLSALNSTRKSKGAEVD